jgi:hypothetical protein
MKEIDFQAKASSCIVMEFRKGKNFFIKHNISRYINMSRCYIETLEPLMKMVVA